MLIFSQIFMVMMMISSNVCMDYLGMLNKILFGLSQTVRDFFSQPKEEAFSSKNFTPETFSIFSSSKRLKEIPNFSSSLLFCGFSKDFLFYFSSQLTLQRFDEKRQRKFSFSRHSTKHRNAAALPKKNYFVCKTEKFLQRVCRKSVNFPNEKSK